MRFPVFRAQRRNAATQSALALTFLFALAFVGTGCGAPGEPMPPSPPIPTAISDLSGHQAGDGVELSFTVPTKSVRSERLKEPPTIEILRGSMKPDGTPDPKSFRVVDTIPGALLSKYQQKDKVVFLDPIPSADVRANPGKAVAYLARSRVTTKRTSADSNIVSLNLYPIPERIDDLESRMTENGVQLSWAAPAKTSGGEPLAKIYEYRVYRGELDTTPAETVAQDGHPSVWKTPMRELAKTQSPEYLDTSFDYGKTYGYVVRSVVSEGGNLIESADSRIKAVTPKDTFPPAAPQGIVAAVLPGANSGEVAVELTWAINTEPDVAGYRVYRSDTGGQRGQLLSQELLPTPAYRDNSVQPDKRYWYTVTAVDRAGNESVPSSEILVETAQPSQ